jgi:peptidyl-tRNA hydrolase
MQDEDPIVLYVVIRELLGMGAGKIAAQSCHASNAILLRYFKAELLKAKCVKCGTEFPATEEEHIRLTKEWLHYQTIIVKQADEAEWQRMKEENPDCYVVIDAGHTEVPAHSETAIGLWPRRKSNAGKLIKRLQLVKKAKDNGEVKTD